MVKLDKDLLELIHPTELGIREVYLRQIKNYWKESIIPNFPSILFDRILSIQNSKEQLTMHLDGYMALTFYSLIDFSFSEYSFTDQQEEQLKKLSNFLLDFLCQENQEIRDSFKACSDLDLSMLIGEDKK